MNATTLAVNSDGYLTATPLDPCSRPWAAVLTPDKRGDRPMRHFCERNGKGRVHSLGLKVGTALEFGSKSSSRRWYGIVTDVALGAVVIEERPTWRAALGLEVEAPPAPVQLRELPEGERLRIEARHLLSRLSEVTARLAELACEGADASFDVEAMR